MPPSLEAHAVRPARNVRKPAPSSGSLPPVAAEVATAPKPKPKRAGESRLFAVARAVVGVIMVLGIGSGVVWGARRYVRTSPRFAVSEIVTSGGKRRGSDELANIAGVAKGQNVFTIDLERARQRLAADPWIESAELTRQLPGTITIRVTEREAGGVVAMTGDAGTYLVTRDGAVMKRVETGDPLDLHVVTGVALKTLVNDREGATLTIRRALDLASDYERSPLAQRLPLQEVHVEANGDMTLIVGKSGALRPASGGSAPSADRGLVLLRMGAAPYRRKLDQAVRIAFELDRRGAKADTIMLDDEARPDRVVVRMR